VTWLLANLRLVGAGLALAALIGGGLWLRGHWIEVGETRVEARYEAARDAQAKRDAEVRAQDQRRNAELSDELALIRQQYGELRAQAPVVLTQTREVTVREGCTCPAVSLGPDFLQRYNDAARNP